MSGCTPAEHEPIDRLVTIPSDAVKMTPETDPHPPVLHSDEFETPVPFEPVNTAGAEDSPFVPADRDEFYLFFTPDVRVPVEKQILDGVTGIWVSRKENGAWQEPERVWLQEPGRLSLDGCQFAAGNTMWFCTAREGLTGIHWATAEWNPAEHEWQDWTIEDFPEEYEVGELHLTDGGETAYFHSARAGGKGENDIWMMTRSGDGWSKPENVGTLNSEVGEGWPYLTPDGNELWFNRWHKGTPAVFRSVKAAGEWQEPELIVESFAGEPTLDGDGNLYFVHHFYDEGVMLEADIYVAYRK